MLFGTQHKPKGLFGGFAPGTQQMQPAEAPMPAMGNPMAQMGGNMGAMSGTMAPKKPGINWLGVLADALAGAAGREGPYAAQMQRQREQDFAAQQAQLQRENGWQDFQRRFDYEQAHQKPANPYRFEDNAGNVWEMGQDGQPRRIFTDMAPKQYMVDGQFVTVANPYAGSQPAMPSGDDEWGPVVNERPGGAGGNASSGFPVSGNQLDRVTIQSESAGNPNAISPKGAMGLWQVMPATARDPGFGITPWNGQREDLNRVGAQYRRKMESRYGGDLAKMWAAYNWGPGAVDKAVAKHGANWLAHAPAETRAYVARNLRAVRGGK